MRKRSNSVTTLTLALLLFVPVTPTLLASEVGQNEAPLAGQAQSTPSEEASERDTATGQFGQMQPSDRLPELSLSPSFPLDGDTLIDKLLETAAQYPAAEAEFNALVDELDPDPNSAFAYVKDHIRLEPYRGVLRGSEGTLSAHAGNVWDRALLLKGLFELQGQETRLVVGELSADDASRLRSLAIAAPPSLSAPEPALALAGLQGQPLKRLEARARRDYAWLSRALRDHTEDIAPNDASDIQPDRHVWVQAKVDGVWKDFDSAFKDAEPGMAIGRLADTMEEPEPRDAHHLDIRVIAESLDSNGRLRESILLAERMTAEAASQSHVFLVFARAAESKGFGGALLGAIGQEARYQPLLMIDGEPHEGKPIPPLGLARSEAQDFFLGSGDKQQETLTALHLEIAASFRDQTPAVQRRSLVDRVAAEDRRNNTIAADRLSELVAIEGKPVFSEGVHQVVTSTGGASPHHAAVGLALAVDFIQERMATDEALKALSLHEALWPLGEFNLVLALAAERLSMRAINDAPDVRFFVAEPRVYLLCSESDPAFGESGRRLDIDLMHDGIGWIAKEGTVPSEVVNRRMRYGVLQSALETTLVELRTLGMQPGSQRVISASTELHPPLRVITSADLPSLPSPYPLDLANDLKAGLKVVVSTLEESDQLDTWWTFDLSSGALVAKLAPALGGARGEGGRLPGSYVNASSGQPRYVVDQNTGNTIGVERGGKEYRYRRPPPKKPTCRGGTEYQIILGCVSIPAGMSVGWGYGLVVGEVALVAAGLVATYLAIN